MIEKVFHAYDVRATVPDPLNEDIAWRIGNATAQFLRTTLSGYDRSDSQANTLVIGRDMRKSSRRLCQAFIEGAASIGTPDRRYRPDRHLADVLRHELHAVLRRRADHGQPQPGELQRLQGLRDQRQADRRRKRPQGDRADRAGDLAFTMSPNRRTSARWIFRSRTANTCCGSCVRRGRCAWPWTRRTAWRGRWFPILFNSVPNLSIVPLNFDHDGDFVHPPNPLVPANLEQLRNAVRDEQADCGACFDGDADRCVFVDNNARIVRSDLVTALLAEQYLRERPGATVVFDLRSSRIVPEMIEKHGGVPKRERVGHVFMKRALSESNGVFGGELSGHFYFRDYFFCDSGMLAFIAVLNVLTRTGKSLAELMEPLDIYASSGERNFENDDKEGTFRRIAEKYKDAEIDYLDGVTVQYRDWWFNVRASNTEPLLRLNMEARDDTLLQKKLVELTPLLGKPVAH